MNADFEAAIRSLTQPINGQYPRPWMTDVQNPLEARVFVIGRNQATIYPVDQVRGHERFVDALFNRWGMTCRGLYNEITRGKPSTTRSNIDAFAAKLRRSGIAAIIETNVVCYSTRGSSAGLSREEHRGGRERGRRIFREILRHIAPPILVVHGAGTRKEFNRHFKVKLPDRPRYPQPPISARRSALCGLTPYRPTVFVIPSLGQPEYNKWKSWSAPHLDAVADEIAGRLAY